MKMTHEKALIKLGEWMHLHLAPWDDWKKAHKILKDLGIGTKCCDEYCKDCISVELPGKHY